MSGDIRCDVWWVFDYKRLKVTLFLHEVPGWPWVKVRVTLFNYTGLNYLFHKKWNPGDWFSKL